jgi:3-isopropylmalate/(R)-2-methylmalate dehydratase small subunit
MEKFTVHTGTGLPLRRSNVDTDQIIPAEFLKRITRTGFEDALFAAWRTEPDFVLNDARYAGASVLVAGTDFGIGSSREHAVWALHDYGFRVVLSSRFGDIFRGNSLKNGLLTVLLEQAAIERLWTLIEAEPATGITVDLSSREVRFAAETIGFELAEDVRQRLLDGADDITLTLRNAEQIAEYERSIPAYRPNTLSFSS